MTLPKRSEKKEWFEVYVDLGVLGTETLNSFDTLDRAKTDRLSQIEWRDDKPEDIHIDRWVDGEPVEDII